MDVPLDNDYTYGEIVEIRKSIAVIQGIGLYSKTREGVHFRYIQKLTGGRRCGKCKEHSKRSIT